MKAIRVHETGELHVLTLEEIALPEPKQGEVRIKNYAAGLNFIEIYHRKGYYPLPLPFTPGTEGAGVVEAVGEGVTRVKIGDRVSYISGTGAYAEYIVINENQIIHLPDPISFVQGAAFGLQGMTAHYLLHEFRTVQAGETILIHAAAGGMGLLLVQWAKHLGARVIGTASSPEKAEIVMQAGADATILYTETDWVAEVKALTNGRGADFIIDGVGKTTFPGDLEAVKTRGTIALYGSASGPADPFPPNSLQKRCLTICGGNLFTFNEDPGEKQHRADAVLKGVQEGWLKLRTDHLFSLEQAREAQSLLEGRASTGKIVLQIAE
jgi:NADPH2:quinone reductase